MKKTLIFLINIFLVVSCVDIKSEPKHTDEATAVDDAWGMRWVENKPCSAPCWEDITPGITLPEDAVSIIKKNETVNLVSVSRKSISIEWATKDYGTINGQIYIDLNTLPNVVDTIELNFSKPIKLEQLVKILGKPKISLMGRCSPVATYFFVIDFYNSGVVYSFPEAMTHIKFHLISNFRIFLSRTLYTGKIHLIKEFFKIGKASLQNINCYT